MNYSRKITTAAVELSETLLEVSRKGVLEFYTKHLGRLPDKEGVLDVDITFDGS